MRPNFFLNSKLNSKHTQNNRKFKTVYKKKKKKIGGQISDQNKTPTSSFCLVVGSVKLQSQQCRCQCEQIHLRKDSNNESSLENHDSLSPAFLTDF